MKYLIQRIKCLFGFHLPFRYELRILDIRYDSHAIDYRNVLCCPVCKRERSLLETSANVKSALRKALDK